jgi:hypothetical protein
MRSFRRRVGLAAILLGIVAGAAWWAHRLVWPAGAASSATVPVVRTNQAPDFAAAVSDLVSRGRGGLVDPRAIAAALAGLSARLDALGPTAAVAALIAALERRVDWPTGLAFRVGAGGNLEAAPTLRVWLLDQLGRRDGAAAAGYAARIYAAHDSADEWAVALRDDWRAAGRNGRLGEVRGRVLELLAEPAWSAQPSIGFLEAFDVGVAALAWEAVPRWESWLGPDRPPALRHAAWIALDRLTQEVPEDLLPRLAAGTAWLDSQPMLRAGLLARADLASPAQRAAVERYLSNTAITEAEGRRFLELVPNVSGTVAHTLVTANRLPSPAVAALRDRTALAVLAGWTADPQMARWAEPLTGARVRLTAQVQAAVQGGYLSP